MDQEAHIGSERPLLEPLEPRLLLDAVRTPWLAGVTENSVWVCLEASNNAFYTAPQAGTSVRWGFAADCRPDSSLGDTSWHNTMAGLIDAQDPAERRPGRLERPDVQDARLVGSARGMSARTFRHGPGDVRKEIRSW